LDPLILEQTFQTNLFGPIHMIQAAYRSMVPGGLVLNITSGLASPDGLDAGWLAYRTSKAALNAMTRVLAKELAGRNIRVNAIAPGWVRTAMGGAEAPFEPGNAAEWILKVIRSLQEGRVDSGALVSFDA
jgi:NAD(P)-dependent dehydrogenase (short-subunit alcohol dehydrogenase family)